MEMFFFNFKFIFIVILNRCVKCIYWIFLGCYSVDEDKLVLYV